MTVKSSSTGNLNVVSLLLGVLIFAIGFSNFFLVHPVPGLTFLLLSLVYFPGTNNFLEKKIGCTIPNGAKILLGIIAVWFTLGVSDLGEILDQFITR